MFLLENSDSAEDQNILEKIRSLFAFRHIPELIEWCHADQPDTLLKGLEHLQSAIYELDSYLESNWELENGSIDQYWQDIFGSLHDLGVKEEEYAHLTRNIRKYEILERGIRQGHSLSRLPIRNAYVIKSCDVKLMRQLCFEKYPNLALTHHEDDWILFDLFTEVHDDLSDVYEDASTYNGNRFLITCIEHGPEEAVSSYRGFLDKLEIELAHFPSSGNSEQCALIHTWTREVAHATSALLAQMPPELEAFDFSESLLSRKLVEAV